MTLVLATLLGLAKIGAYVLVGFAAGTNLLDRFGPPPPPNAKVPS